MIFCKRPYIFCETPVRATPRGKDKIKGKGKTMRAFKVILLLVVLGFAGLVGYAYLGDLTPEPSPQSHTVTAPGAGNGN